MSIFVLFSCWDIHLKKQRYIYLRSVDDVWLYYALNKWKKKTNFYKKLKIVMTHPALGM